MTVRNVRRMVTDPYDPKQRIVGGIVLFLLMLLLYVILKIMLSLFTVRESNYTLHEALPDEILMEQMEVSMSIDNRPTTQTNKRVPAGFVFLDLSGNPMQTNDGNVQTDIAATLPTTSTGENWVVQIASFKENNRAQDLVQQLKNKGMDAQITKVGSWYAVRLLPQDERSKAERQGRQVSNLGLPGIRHPLIKKID